jgi:hypothetical protein
MKKTIWFVLILVSVAASLLAQEQPTQYLFGRGGKVRLGGFGGTITDFTNLAGEFAVYNGGGGAAIFNRRFFIGGFGQSLVTNHNRQLQDQFNNTVQGRFEMTYGGLWTGLNFSPESIVHGTVAVRVAGGRAAWLPQNSAFNNNAFYQSNVMVVIPTLGAEVNLFRWMKLTAEGGYRFVSALPTDFPVYTNQNLSGFTGSLTLRFGWFGEPRGNE